MAGIERQRKGSEDSSMQNGKVFKSPKSQAKVVEDQNLPPSVKQQQGLQQINTESSKPDAQDKLFWGGLLAWPGLSGTEKKVSDDSKGSKQRKKIWRG